MKYKNIVEAIFIKRPNRFISHCLVDGVEVIAHVKNTGRCAELLIEGVTVYLEYAPSPTRKTDYSLIAVLKGNRLINMDSQAPNKIAFEALKSGVIKLPGLVGKISLIKQEFKYKNSRFDLYVETKKEKVLIEVKGVTLEVDGVAMFPDATTARGDKHVNDLIRAKQEGYLAYVIFIVQMANVAYFKPNVERDPKLAESLKVASKAGVGILAYDCCAHPDEIRANAVIKVEL